MPDYPRLAIALLTERHLRFDTLDPAWPDRDRAVIEPCLEPPAPFTCIASPIGVAAGLALAERVLAGRFGRSLVDHRTWAIAAGDTLATGAVQEAAWLAGAWRLGRLCVVTSVDTAQAPGLAGFAANGWALRIAASNDAEAIGAGLSAATRSHKPTLIACVGPVVREDPCDVAVDSHDACQRQPGARRIWLKRLARHGQRVDFQAATGGRPAMNWHMPLSGPGAGVCKTGVEISTAGALRQVLSAMGPAPPELVMLPGDPGWPPPQQQHEPPLGTQQAAGRLWAGIADALFGSGLHGGLVPFCVQPAAALAQALPALRSAALHGVRLVQVFVEPSAGSGQNGQRAGLRTLGRVHVFRPADASEALECCELALRRQDGPSVLLLSETPVPILADTPSRARSIRGGCVIAEPAGRRAVTLVASGPEVALAIRVRARLGRQGIATAVVSLACWELFAQSEDGWREAVLGDAPRIGLESGSGFGWERWLGPRGLFIETTATGDDAVLAACEAVRRHLATCDMDR